MKPHLSKRARVVVEHIMEHGSITTEELKDSYGYDHPPRAARDVREAGIPLKTSWVKSKDGRRIAEYKFGDLQRIQKDRLSGRQNFPKKFKDKLYRSGSGKCSICLAPFESRYLQIDHRVPYEVAGDRAARKLNRKDYMLLCASCNRAKDWSCKHCPNWTGEKRSTICLKCYWASPENYTHIALREVRRLDILWEKDEVKIYERLKRTAQRNKEPLPDYVKEVIARQLERNNA